MYARALSNQKDSFFLFGPRGTGKSTWVRQNYPLAHTIDLLKVETYLRYQSTPSSFRFEMEAQKPGQWIFIDEIQKLPWLLDEVHSFLEEHPKPFRFILTGSSARKIKRDGGNLLAGRATVHHLYPFSSYELGSDFRLDLALRFGCLPLVVNQTDIDRKIEVLNTYSTVYLKEEIQQEAAVKNLGAFSRFLRIAALQNGQKTNLSSLSRDAGISRSTAQGYFQILIDTLIGDLLYPWKSSFRVKEIDHPKFYFFDTGVVRTLLNQLYDPLHSIEKGFQFETLVLHELKCFNSYKKVGGEFYFWGTHGGSEVDFIYSRGRTVVGFEVKATDRWKSEYGESVLALIDAGKLKRGYGIYLGSQVLKDRGITVYPFERFVEKLWSGELALF